MNNLFLCLIIITLCLLSTGRATAADWRFPVGVGIIIGFSDIKNLYEDNLQAEGDETEPILFLPNHSYFING